MISLNGINIGSLDTHYWIFVCNVANLTSNIGKCKSDIFEFCMLTGGPDDGLRLLSL